MRKADGNLFLEMSESNEQAMAARLTAAGFEDINLREVLVLAALQMSGHDTDPARVPHELVDGLVKRGYLAGHNDAVLTSRAHRAVTVAKDGVPGRALGFLPVPPR